MTTHRERRYAIAPQMRDYDRLEEKQWLPYVMFFQPPGYRSRSFTTDERGFRTTIREGRSLSFSEFCAAKEPRAVLVGGSTAFGVGATCDAQTLASHLNRAGKEVWFNFAGRAFNSTQEWLLFLLHLPPDVQTVVIFSGVNNLALSHLASSTSPVYNSIYVQSVFEQALAQGKPRGVQGAARELLRELGRKVTEVSSWPGSANGSGRRVTEERMRDIFTCFQRDMRIWALLRKAVGFQIFFVFQPIASWMRKALSTEERDLFSILDEMQGPHWDSLAGYLTDWAPHYLEQTRRICDSLGVPFLDLNACASFCRSRWLFVDRAHLTDEGYALCAEEIRKGLL